jgi:tripartite-type tricarboxylate transporter receptor subunit TctC
MRFVVPYTAGGGVDIAARILGQKLSEHWGQPVVIDNRAGGNGIIGQEVVARATADGHTVLIQSVAFAVNPSLYKLPYDTNKDFIPITQIAGTPLMLVVNPAVAAKSVKELVALAKSKPNQLNYASFGSGSIAHLAGELFKTTSGIEMVHVAYKGAAPALTDVLSGQIQVMFPSISTVLGHIKTGKLRGLAVTMKHRSPHAPEMPTMIEAGVPGYEAVSWVATFLPGGTPRPFVIKLHDEVVRIVKLPDVKSRLDTQGYDLTRYDPAPDASESPQKFSRFVQAESEKFAKLVKEAGLKAE